MDSKIYPIETYKKRWLKLTNVRVLAIILTALFVFSACAPMTSVRNGLEYQSKLRDQITGNNSTKQNVVEESPDAESDSQMAKIAAFEEKLLAAKKEKAEVKKQIELLDTKPTTIIQPEESRNEEVAVAGVQSKDDAQDEEIQSNQRKLLTFKEQFSSLETKHDQLATKVSQIEEELKFLRSQVIALNSRKETFINRDVAKTETKKATNPIIESDENIAKKEQKQVQVEEQTIEKISTEKLDLAEQFYNKGKYEDAITAYVAALEDIKSNKIKSEVLYKVAMSHYQLKHFEKSIAYFDQVCSLSENMYKDDAQIQIAEANMRLGKIDEAKKAYQNVLAEYPRSKHIPKARKMLQQL